MQKQKKQVLSIIEREMRMYLPGDIQKRMRDLSSIEKVNYVADYYDRHLYDIPLGYAPWHRVNALAGNISEKLAVNLDFVQIISEFLSEGEQKNYIAHVIDTYTLGKEKHPVFKFAYKTVDIVLKFDYFSGWVVSIRSRYSLNIDFLDTFNTMLEVPEKLQKGLPEEYQYGSYNSDHSMFTAQFESTHELYIFIFLLKHNLT